MSPVADKLILLLSDILDVDPKVVIDEANLAMDLGCSSLDAIVIAQQIEEDFNIELMDAEMDRVRTVGDLIILVEQKIKV
jgi:acyl carrier protein